MNIRDKLLMVIKIETKKRLDKTIDCINFLDEVIETYVNDQVVRNSAKRCVEYLRQQVTVIRDIIKEL